ncbi:MAG TPA: gliding motility-associated C-terminal domain-containing protein [Chitinophagaceae bacterium]|nr:gliding motility-associated C-terminal domain-containing protein [Chitinophagaceae bacterium]
MRRCLILIVALILAQLNVLYAQTTFIAPDTVCIRQPITMTPVDTNASSYYWSFCSGYLMNRPNGNLLGATFGITNATDIEIAKDVNGNYYGFAINRTVPEFIRLDFGTSLANVPTFTSLGNLGGTLPQDINSLFLMKDDLGNNVMFAVGGASIGNSSLFRLDFGKSLANKPNAVNMHNHSGFLNAPRGFFAVKEGAYWFGFAVNALDNKLLRFDFGTNISNTPNVIDVGNPSGALNQPSDMAAVKDAAGDWNIFVTNFASSTVTHLDFGASITSLPTGTVMPVANLLNPSSIILARECGVDYLFIANATKNSLMRLAFTSIPALTYTATSLDFLPGMKTTVGLSHVIREKDNLYSFVVNADGSLGALVFANCVSSSQRSSTDKFPAPFTYSVPGRYSVFLSKDEGLPTASMECHTIDALPIPSITIVDDTLICQGDTANLFGIAFGTSKLEWRPNYNVTHFETDEDALFTRVYPDYSRPYHFVATYPNGCIVDSPIVVNVSKVKADAGVDRVLADGSTTVLGGPMTTEGDLFSYVWTPTNFLNDPLSPNPSSTPFYDVTYALTVTTKFLGCVATDTVVVRVGCNDVNLPNAFTPEDHSANNDFFGLINKNVIKLNFFRIYDRWGKEVFSTTDISKQWNGQFDGVDCPYGVYVWSVDGFCSSGKRISKQGNVTLIR